MSMLPGAVWRDTHAGTRIFPTLCAAVAHADLSGQRHAPADESYQAPSLDRLEWEHIQRVLHDHGGNISRAAEALGLHRRSLQRKLQKFPPNQ
jgi:two-component system response regulator RegA